MDFHNLFKGRDDAYGVYIIERSSSTKVSGRAYTKTEPLIEQHYRDHLDGKDGLGVIPIMPDGMCWWGAIDIDDYKAPLETLNKQMESMELPLVLCRSKSGGAHIFLFLKEALPALILRNKLFEFAAALGHPDAELFPKQVEFQDESEVGNWINLPYFEADRTTRYALKDGSPLSLDEFLEHAEAQSVTEKQLKEFEPKLIDDLQDAPPCLQYLATVGVFVGQKDSSLFNYAVYCKMKYKESWEGELEIINQTYIHPPAKAETILKVIKPHRKKTYFYTCEQAPLKDFCNRELCLGREFGVGQSDGSPKINIGILRKLETEPPIWYLIVEGHDVKFDTMDLIDQNRFRKVCFESIDILPKKVKDNIWDRILQERLEKVEHINAPVDAGPEGQFLFHLQNFCTVGTVDDRDGLLRHRPWVCEEDERTYFQSADLIRYLNTKKFYAFNTNEIYTAIRSIGGENKTLKIKGKVVRVWHTPIFEKQTEEFDLPDIETTPF